MSFLTYFFANSFIIYLIKIYTFSNFISTCMIESFICQSRQIKDYKLFLLIFFNFEKELSTNTIVTGAIKSMLQTMTTLG